MSESASLRHPNYGETPELLDLRVKLDAMRAGRRGPVDKLADLARGRVAARELEVFEAYRAVFMPNGPLSDAAAVVLGDLAVRAGLGGAAPVLDHAEMCVTEGLRRLLLHLLSRLNLSPERAAALEAQLEKNR